MCRFRLPVSLVVLAWTLVVGSRIGVSAQVQGSQRPGELTPLPILQGLPDTVPARVHDVRPAYPPEAAAAGVSGPVVLKIAIDAAGQVTDAKILKGDVTLAKAALDAVRQWRYQPPSTAPVFITVGVNVVNNSRLATTGDRVRVGGQIKAPAKIKDVHPLYPDAARTARVQGIVMAEVTIDPSGIVTDAQITRSIPMLDVAALDAIMQWGFEPRPDIPPVRMTVTVNFKLDSKSDTDMIGGIVGGPVIGGILEGKDTSKAAAGTGGGRGGGSAKPAGVAGGTPSTSDPVRVGSIIASPFRTKYVAPVYPQEAKAAKIEGVVVVEVLVGKDGKVESAKVLRSIPALDEAAVAAVRQWEFAPTLLNGAPIPIVMTATVNFKLQ